MLTGAVGLLSSRAGSYINGLDIPADGEDIVCQLDERSVEASDTVPGLAEM